MVQQSPLGVAKFEIKHRRTGAVLWSRNAKDLRAAVASAVRAGANLAGADLTGADLARADLARADLTDALRPYRDDIYKVLDAAPAEVGGLLEALWQGRVDGSTYTGECACLVGTIVKVRGVAHTALGALRPDSSRPTEQWFLSIRKGDRPDTNPAAAFATAVIARWMYERGVTHPVTLKTEEP